MAKYLTSRACQEIADSTIVELGAGCGFAGIYLSNLAKKVIMTDIPGIVPLIQFNIEANNCS